MPEAGLFSGFAVGCAAGFCVAAGRGAEAGFSVGRGVERGLSVGQAAFIGSAVWNTAWQREQEGQSRLLRQRGQSPKTHPSAPADEAENSRKTAKHRQNIRFM